MGYAGGLTALLVQLAASLRDLVGARPAPPDAAPLIAGARYPRKHLPARRSGDHATAGARCLPGWRVRQRQVCIGWDSAARRCCWPGHGRLPEIPNRCERLTSQGSAVTPET
ncbi:MAG: hypothetical protein IPO15_24475 [Anaerolineae bacterium]|uniref:hypothetical protein n=1 Tax=Candidatus Amarolinea dominans TaxID=3140696 RepID=UPI003134B703|nr:hypothetical protein [Anaerolineae bacterium]